jgi:hypothetical protein
MIKTIPTNQCKVIVEPRNAGNFGFMRISGQERTVKEEYALCEEIKDNIKRHIDDIEYVFIEQEHKYVSENGNEYDSLFELLDKEYAEEQVADSYTCRYVRPSDNGTGTQSYAYNFQELVEKAYNNPWDFKVTHAYPELTLERVNFLDKVIELGLKKFENQ